MRQILATVLFYCAVTLGVYAADDNGIQQGIFDSYLKLANEGDVVAQYIVAQRYETGKGTEKNPEKAIYWYEQAAKKNYPLALVKLEAHKKQTTKTETPEMAKPVAAPAETIPAPAPVKKQPTEKPVATSRKKANQPAMKPVKAPAVVPADLRPTLPEEPAPRREEIKPKPAEKIAAPIPVPVPAPEIVVARATPVEETPAPSINVMQALLAGKWKHHQYAAEYLPSARAACLQSSGTEIVCFSEEMTRNLENTGLTYNVKSVISGVSNKEAKFNLRYVYNVMHVSGRPYANPSGMPNEIGDMITKTGWQEPGVTMECRLRDERNLGCTRQDRKLSYQFVRE